MCPQQNCALLKYSFIRRDLTWLFFRAFFNLLMKKNSDKEVLFTNSLETSFCVILQVLSYSLEIFTPPCWCPCSFIILSLGVACLLCASPTSSLSFCLIGLIRDGGACCPDRQTNGQAGVPWQSPSGGPSRPWLSPAGFIPVRLQASLKTNSYLLSMSRLCSHCI